MARIVVEVGDTIKDKLRELVEYGYYKTESEIVREALRKFLMQENKRNGNSSFIDAEADAEVFEEGREFGFPKLLWSRCKLTSLFTFMIPQEREKHSKNYSRTPQA